MFHDKHYDKNFPINVDFGIIRLDFYGELQS